MSISQNTDIITQISEFTSQNNIQLFTDKIKLNIPTKFQYIHISNIAFIDSYGRATFFYIELDDIQIPFYQPGTFCFKSAINPENEDLCVIHNGSQQNGPILGAGCATFIAKFMSTLAQNYERMKVDQYNNKFDKEIYKIALLATLNTLSPEDAQHHGRLLEMRDYLLNLSSVNINLENYEEVFFYLKELQKLGKINSFTEIEINNAKFSFSQEELKKAQAAKQQGRLYAPFDKFFRPYTTHSLFASNQFSVLKDYLIQKNGIFNEEYLTKDQLQTFLGQIKEVKKFLITNDQLRKPMQGDNKQKGLILDSKKINSANELNTEDLQQQQQQQVRTFLNPFKQEQQQFQTYKGQLSIPQDFFKPSIPQYLKLGYQESPENYAQRVIEFFLILESAELVYIISQIDPSRQDMASFLQLTHHVMQIKLQQKQQKQQQN